MTESELERSLLVDQKARGTHRWRFVLNQSDARHWWRPEFKAVLPKLIGDEAEREKVRSRMAAVLSASSWTRFCAATATPRSARMTGRSCRH